MPHTAYELVQENEAGGPEAERPGLLRGFIQEEGNMWKDFLGKLGAAGNAQGLQTGPVEYIVAGLGNPCLLYTSRFVFLWEERSLSILFSY